MLFATPMSGELLNLSSRTTLMIELCSSEGAPPLPLGAEFVGPERIGSTPLAYGPAQGISKSHWHSLYVSQILDELQFIPLRYELPVGIPLRSGAALVGSVDLICVNRRGNLALVDVKTTAHQSKDIGWLVVKKKNYKQLNLYAKMLIRMAEREEIEIPPIEELVIIGLHDAHNFGKAYVLKNDPRVALSKDRDYKEIRF